MRILTAGLTYFLQVFAAGFALALLRIPVLVPAFGVRMAELLEMPFMLAIIAWASRRLLRHSPALDRAQRLRAGLFALLLLVGAELLLALALGAGSVGDYIASRDPVSGGAYLVALLFFGVAPALWRLPPGPGPSAVLSLRTLAMVLAVLGAAFEALAFWGLRTAAGRTHFDEMAGMIPLAALPAGLICLLAAAFFAWRNRLARRDH